MRRKTDEANNTGLQTKRVGRGEKVRFTYNMPTATDQEIIVYAGHYLKSLGDVSNLQPTSMLIANADRLTEIVCHSPNLINTDLSECTKLQRIDLSDCTALGTGIGAQPILNIQNCKYLRYCDCRNTQLTAIYTMQAGGNLEEIYYPQSTQVVQLSNQTYLHTVGLPSTNPCENLADVMITNCNAIKTLSSETTVLDFNTLKYVQNLNITNSLSGLNSMHFNGFDKLKNVTLSSLKELASIGFEDMMPVTTTSTLKNITISDCPLITSLSFNVSSDDYKVAFASGGKLDLGGLQSLKSIECNTSVKGLDTLIVPTSLTELRFTTEHGDGINEIKNIWSASAVHNNDGFEGIDFQDMTIEFIDMLGLNSISNAINFHIAPKTQNPNLNTARDGSESKPWFHPIGSIDLSNYTGLMIGMLRGIDLNKLDVVINTDRDQVDLTSLFECATLPTAQNIVTKTNNILAKFPKSVIWDYMFKGCDLSFSPKDIRIPNRGLSLKGMYKDSNVTEDVSLPNVIMAVDEMFMNCTGITTYEKNWLKTYSKITYTVPTSNGTSGSWDDNGNYTEGTNYNQFLYTPSDGEKAFKIMTTGTGTVRINYFYNASFMSRVVYTPESDSYPYVVTIPDGCNKVIFVCDKAIRFSNEGAMTTSNCYTNTGGALSEIPTSWGGYGLDKNVTSIYVIDTTLLTNTTTFNLVLNDNQAGITDWGDGVTNSEKSHTYAEHGVYTIKTKSWSNGTPSDDLKTALIEVKQIKLIGHNGNSKDYSNSFNGCSKLTKVTAYNLAPSDCSGMFRDCSLLTEIVGLDTWDMSGCTTIESIFNGCTSLTGVLDLSNWDLSSLEMMPSAFCNSGFREIKFNKISLPSLGIGTYFQYSTFMNCSNLISNPYLDMDTSRISHINLRGCSSLGETLDLRNIDTTNLKEIVPNPKCTTVIVNPSKPMNMSFRDSNVVTVKDYWLDTTYNDAYSNYYYNDLTNKSIDINFVGTDYISDWVGWNSLKLSYYTVNSLVSLFNCLKDYASEGDTTVHTLNMGSEALAKLTDEQKMIAVNKGWFLTGYNTVRIPAGMDISGFTTDNNITKVYIELTADNYTTRIDEVLGVYTNAVDVYFFDDGSVTNLDNMCYGNNTTTKDRIQNVTFLDGYFENCTSFMNTLRELKGLVTVTGMPDNVTNMTYAFTGCPLLTIVDAIPSKCKTFFGAFSNCAKLISVPENGYTGNMSSTFRGCYSLNQQINIVNPTNLERTFNDCGELTISPTFTGTYTNTIDNLFNGCRKLTNIVLPTTWRPSSAISTFINCTQLVTIENLDALDMSNCSDMGNMFFACGKLFEVNLSNFDTGSCKNFGGMFQACSSLIEIDVSSFDINNTNGYLGSMFQGCTSLISIIGLDKFNTSKVTSTAHMFLDCPALSELDLSNWDFSNINTITKTFGACTSLTKITLNNITDNSTREAGVGLRGALNTLPQPVEIVMDEFAMTDFSNLFLGVTKIKNDIVFPSNATNVSNCFKDCTGITHIHSNWKNPYVLSFTPKVVVENNNKYTEIIPVSDVETVRFESSSNNYLRCIGYDSNKQFIGYYDFNSSPSWVSSDKFTLTSYITISINRDDIKYIRFGSVSGTITITKTYKPKDVLEATTDCYAGCTGITHCDGVDLGVCDYITGLDEVPIAWGGFGFSKDVTGIYVINIPSDNYSYELGFGRNSKESLTVTNGTVNWGDGTVTQGEVTHTYATAGIYTVKGHITHSPGLTVSMTPLIEVKQIPLSRTTSYYNKFYGCTNLTKVTIYNYAPTACNVMFKNCSSLTEIVGLDTWDMSNCTDCIDMFNGASSLNISRFPDNFFYNCTLQGAFENNKSIVNIDLSNQGKINGMRNAFKNCTKLEEVTLDNIDFTSLKDAEFAFDDCSSLKTINMKNCTFTTFSMNYFADDGKISNFYMDGSTGTITYITIYAFWAASNLLTNINWGNMVITGDVVFNGGLPNATVETLVNTFNALYDYSMSGETHSIIVGATALAKLTDEQKMIATNKGWTIS